MIGRVFTLDQLKLLLEDITEDRLLEVLEEALTYPSFLYRQRWSVQTSTYLAG